jgi:hypothetical protein
MLEMPTEPGLRQRQVVGRQIAFADSELATKYTLPFVDATWEVPFVVLDLLGRPPQVLRAPIRSDGTRLHTSVPIGSLRPIESIPVSEYARLVHWDPWWAFRGVSGIDRMWIQAVFATNIAHPLRHAGKTFKIHDLRFADDMTKLEAVIAKDDLFRPSEVRSGDIDLLALRQKPHGPPEKGRTAPTAKAL